MEEAENWCYSLKIGKSRNYRIKFFIFIPWKVAINVTHCYCGLKKESNCTFLSWKFGKKWWVITNDTLRIQCMGGFEYFIVDSTQQSEYLLMKKYLYKNSVISQQKAYKCIRPKVTIWTFMHICSPKIILTNRELVDRRCNCIHKKQRLLIRINIKCFYFHKI